MRKNGFFAMLTRMRHIARWGLMRNNVRENLSEHSFDTAVTAHALALIGQEYFGATVDPARVAAAALFHDATEILTGDLPTPVKYHNHTIQSAYQQIERGAADRLIAMLPDRLRPHYRVLLTPSEDDAQLRRYIKAADKLTAHTKCLQELESGNREFLHAAQQTLQAVHAMQLPEAEHYIAHFLPAFSLSLDRLQEEE